MKTDLENTKAAGKIFRLPALQIRGMVKNRLYNGKFIPAAAGMLQD
jgi:hypothetical protein